MFVYYVDGFLLGWVWVKKNGPVVNWSGKLDNTSYTTGSPMRKLDAQDTSRFLLRDAISPETRERIGL